MNAITPIKLAEPCAWTAAAAQVNGWRGEAVHWFTCAEAAVNETLRALSPGANHPFVGTRFNSLAALLAEHPKAAEALAAFMPLLEQRVALCHGAAKILLDRRGEWTVRLKWLEFGKNTAERQAVWDQGEAIAFLATLRKHSLALTRALHVLRQPVSPAPASTSR